MQPEFINGPTNYAYLKGNIDGIEKEIHLFFDKHFDLDDQTRCKSYNSIDISYYLYKLIKESTEPLDFFMEIRTSQIDEPNSNKRDIYIKDVINLFKSEFTLKKNDNLNVEHSDTNPNVRLHYFDIRDHLNIFYLTKITTQKIIKYINLLNTPDEKNKSKYIEKILNYLNLIASEIEILNYNTKEVSENKKNIVYDKKSNKQKYYLDKIINKYENINLGKNINIFLDIHCKAVINKIDVLIQNIKYMVTNKILMDKDKIRKITDELGENILQLYCFYTDAYLLRRILDKNYVKKSIIYSGGSHSVNYIYFLVKFCNFKIIKINISKEKNIDELMKKINNEIYSFDIYDLFLLKKINVQCIRYVPLGLNDTISAGLRKYSLYNTL